MSYECIISKSLQSTTTDEQKTWIITEAILKTLPDELSNAVKVAAIPHWFDASVLAALLSVDTAKAEKIYEGIKALSFSEPFGDLGYALHDLTRTSILLHIISTNPVLLKKLSQLAYGYFCKFEDEQNTVEAIYHLFANDKELSMEKLNNKIKHYVKTNNFSATNNLIRNINELVKLDIFGYTEEFIKVVGSYTS